MEKISDKNEVVSNMDKMYKNMLAEGTWKNTSEKDTKIVALSTKLDKTNEKLKEVKKQLANAHGNGPSEKRLEKGGGGRVARRGTMRARCEPWQVTKVGDHVTHPKTGAKYVWCPHHKSKDGTIDGMYMKHPHDHEAWLERRAQFDQWKKEGRQGQDRKRKANDPAGNSQQPNASKLKLALNQKLTTALVTQHHLSQTEADSLFNEMYQEAKKEASGN